MVPSISRSSVDNDLLPTSTNATNFLVKIILSRGQTAQLGFPSYSRDAEEVVTLVPPRFEAERRRETPSMLF